MNIQVINIEYSVISNEYPVDLQRISDRIIKCYNIQSNVKMLKYVYVECLTSFGKDW